MTLSTSSSKPNKEINFTFRSKPNSMVYMLAVDHSVNLLKTGNDVTEKLVLDELSAYKNFEKLKYSGSHSDDSRYIDAGISNSFIITNAYEGYVSCLQEREAERKVPNNDEEIDLGDSDEDEFESLVRKSFTETWIFDKIKLNKKGFGKLDRLVPDTITSWDITAFSLSKEHGLGIAKPQKLTVSQKFFLMLNFPYSVRIGEILRVDVSVFNYYPKLKNIIVDVTFYSETKKEDTSEETEIDYDDSGETEFDFYKAVKTNNVCIYKSLNAENAAKSMTKTISIATGTGTSTYFYIMANSAGKKTVKVRAEIRGQKVFDEVHKTLLVEYDGKRVEENFAYLIDLRENERDSHQEVLFVSDEAIKKSIKIESAAFGDLIGPALITTENLM